jgi:hypothetical protein
MEQHEVRPVSKPIVSAYLATNEPEHLTATRAIIVFGKNSATYKFALLKTLMDQPATTELKYEDIGVPFLTHLLEHHRTCPHQFNRSSTQLAKAMDDHIAGDMGWDKLFSIAERNIYNNVFDALQNVGGGTIAENERLFRHEKNGRKIVLTDALHAIQEDPITRFAISKETEARWRVVEEAWRLGVSPNLLYDAESGVLYRDDLDRRVNLRSAVDTLMSYQKGACFYCNKRLGGGEQDHHSHNFPDVDHFIPFVLRHEMPVADVNINGIWNLVVACRDCNRGTNGKSDQIASEKYYTKLLVRNLCALQEHGHALKSSIQLSMNVQTESALIAKHRQIYAAFSSSLSKWAPPSMEGAEWHGDV